MEYNQKDHIQQRKDRIDKVKSDIRSGKINSDKKKPVVDEGMQNPQLIRNRLAEEYNRLIREGNPETKELREQIHDQITKLESAIEGNDRTGSGDTETSGAAED